jgi:hypothetical protein
MRFPPADRAREADAQVADPDAGKVPEPSKAPESETQAPHPYL